MGMLKVPVYLPPARRLRRETEIAWTAVTCGQAADVKDEPDREKEFSYFWS